MTAPLAPPPPPLIAEPSEPAQPSDDSRATSLVAAGIVLFLLVAYLPGIAQWQYVTRLALVLPVAGWGIVELGRLAWRGDRTAQVIAALIAWGLFASLVSPEPWQATTAGFLNDLQWQYQAAGLACWGVGRRLVPADRPLLTGALLVGLGANALLAIAQTQTDGFDLLRLMDGRALGFQASSIFLGALMAGALVLCANLAGRTARWWWTALVGVALAAIAADLSGTRSALLLGVPLALVAVRRAGWRRMGLVAGAVVVGLVLTSSVLGAGGTSSTDRMSSGGGGGGVTARTTMWQEGLGAAAERPLTGWGVGRFRTATSPQTTADFVLAEGLDREYFDAHNLFVEQLVTTGLPGLLLLVGLLWTLRGRVGGPLAWFAAGVSATWLLEPISVATLPLVMIALGAAHQPPGPPDPDLADEARADAAAGAGRHRSVALSVLTAVLVLAGLVQGVRIVQTGQDLREAQEYASMEAMDRVRSRFPRDAALADTAAIIATANTGGNPESPAAAVALASARDATRLEPSRAAWWSRRARSEAHYSEGAEAERLERARTILLRGHERNPWLLQVLWGLHDNAVERGDEADISRWRRDLCAIDACPEAPS